jgi:hypothetical protein
VLNPEVANGPTKLPLVPSTSSVLSSANTLPVKSPSNGPVDAVNGALPEGSVGLDQIMALMNK